MFVDDESYNSGHGRAYKAFGIDPEKGALVVVRPDHCELIPFLLIGKMAGTGGRVTDMFSRCRKSNDIKRRRVHS